MADNEHKGRRAFLKGALGTSLAAGLAVPALASAETPIMRLFAEWQRLTDLGDEMVATSTDATDADLDLIYVPREAVEDQMMALPSITPADFAAKLVVDTARGQCWAPWETGLLWKEARSLLGLI